MSVGNAQYLCTLVCPVPVVCIDEIVLPTITDQNVIRIVGSGSKLKIMKKIKAYCKCKIVYYRNCIGTNAR